MEIDADANNYSIRNTNIGESTHGSKALYQDQYGQTILNGKVYTQIRCENFDGISITNGSGSPDDPIVIKGTDGTIRMNGTTTFANAIVGDITGNADTATKFLATKNIGGVAFDGSTNINLPGVNTIGNQSTSGNAGSVTNGVYTTETQTITGATSFHDLRIGNASNIKWDFSQSGDELHLEHNSAPGNDFVINNSLNGVYTNMVIDGIITAVGFNLNSVVGLSLIEGGVKINQSGAFTVNVGSNVNIIYSYASGASYFGTASQTLNLRSQNQQTYLSGYTTTGTVSVTTGGRLITSSDKRLKENITNYDEPSIEKIKKLKPSYYNWIEDNDKKRELGFIAQDVETVIPEAVDGKKYEYEWEKDDFGKPILDASGNLIFTDKERHRGFSDRPIIAVMVKAIQEQQEQIEEMKAKLETIFNA